MVYLVALIGFKSLCKATIARNLTKSTDRVVDTIYRVSSAQQCRLIYTVERNEDTCVL